MNRNAAYFTLQPMHVQANTFECTIRISFVQELYGESTPFSLYILQILG